MWIKIKGRSINFNNVIGYGLKIVANRGINGISSGDTIHKLWIETINEDDNYGGFYFDYDTLIEAKAIIKQLDKILNVVEL